MRHITLLALIAVIAATGVVPSVAQRTLTLNDAVNEALKNNRQLAMARLEQDKADYRVAEAIGNALPNVTASGTYSRAIKKQVFFLPRAIFEPGASGYAPLEFGLDNTFQFGFSATQILFNSAVFTGVGTAKIYQKASREMYRSEYNKTIASVKRAFYGALLSRSVRDMMQASLKNAEDNLANVRTMNTQGLVSDYDFIRAEVQVGNVRPAVIEAERAVLMATNGLKVLLGIAPSEEITLSGSLDFDPIDPGVIENAEKVAIAENAGLRALEFQRQVSDELVSIYRSESYPTLAAFGNYQWQAQKNDFKLTSNDLVRTSTVGLSLNLNLFNGFQTRSRVNQAQVDFLKTDEQVKFTRDALVMQVQNLVLRLEEARKRFESQTRTVEQAEKGYKIATTRYSAGTGTQLEINDADIALMRSRVNRVQAVYDYSVARADLEEILSAILPE
ncbi:MAG: TolC family protein [Ignavibacteriae bacterium]|nr:TolC family protein [Ignavibacteriota bacterium]